jgi:hypothetical protein
MEHIQTARPRALELTERQWQELIVDMARLHGWWVHHHYDARHSTPGWPDLVLMRPPELVFVELKTNRGRVTTEQRDVLAGLAACGVETAVWRPADEVAVFARLSSRSPSGQAR